MKTKKKILVLMVLAVSTMSVSAQNAYKKNRSYDGGIGSTDGVETVTYTANADGENILNGPYSFVGKNDIKQRTLEFHGTYNINTQVKNESINGVYTQKADYKHKEWSLTYGWQTWTSYSSMTGTFRDGKPDGLFKYTFKDDLNDDQTSSGTYRSNICHNAFSGNVTIKKGMIIGAVKWYGWTEKHKGFKDEYYSQYFAGQLTPDYKFTGTWKEGSSPDDASTLTFINNVLINKVTSDGQTPIAQQNIAKLYAAGKLSKEQLLEKGYMAVEDSLCLTSTIISTLTTREFGLTQCPAKYSFDNIKEPVFINIKECERDPKFTKEGFKIWLNAVRTNKEFKDDMKCSLDPNFRDTAYFVRCCEAFARKYAGCNKRYDQEIPLTKEQAQQYLNVRDSIFKSKARPFTEYLNMHYDEREAMSLLRQYEQGEEKLLIYLYDEMPNWNKYIWNKTDEGINYIRRSKNDSQIEYSQDKAYFRYKLIVYQNGFDKFDTIASLMNHATYVYTHFDNYWDTIHSNNYGILVLCKPYKEITKEYKEYRDNSTYYPHTEYKGYKSILYIKEVLQKQEDYKTAINTYIAKRKVISDNNAQLLIDGKPYKQLLKAYQTYMKGADITWKGIGQYTTLDEVQKNQEIFSKAFKNAKAADIDVEVKNSDKSLSTVLGIIAKY